MQPHAIWALAWSSKLVSLWCRCCRTADEVSAYGRTFGTDGGTGLGTYSQFRRQTRWACHIFGGSSQKTSSQSRSAGTPIGEYYTSGHWWATRRDCVMWWKCTTSAECKTIRIAMSMVMDDTWIFLDIQEPCFATSLYPYSGILWRTWGVEDTHFDEKYHTEFKTCFHLKLFLQNYYGITNKIGFSAKEPYSLPLKPHVVNRAFPGRHVEYEMYSRQSFCFTPEIYEDQGADYDYYDDPEVWGRVDYIDFPVAEMESLRKIVSAVFWL